VFAQNQLLVFSVFISKNIERQTVNIIIIIIIIYYVRRQRTITKKTWQYKKMKTLAE